MTGQNKAYLDSGVLTDDDRLRLSSLAWLLQVSALIVSDVGFLGLITGYCSQFF
jgi:hypothetical protein